MAQLDNPRHEAFAQAVASGMSQADAHRQVYGPCSDNIKQGSELIRCNPDISSRVSELQARSATSLTMNMQERRERLARIVRCDLNKIDLEKDGDLLQEKTTRAMGDGSTITKLKLPGKRECIMDDAKLAGEIADPKLRVEHSGQVNHTHRQITEERRAVLIEKRKQATNRLAAAQQASGVN